MQVRHGTRRCAPPCGRASAASADSPRPAARTRCVPRHSAAPPRMPRTLNRSLGQPSATARPRNRASCSRSRAPCRRLRRPGRSAARRSPRTPARRNACRGSQSWGSRCRSASRPPNCDARTPCRRCSASPPRTATARGAAAWLRDSCAPAAESRQPCRRTYTTSWRRTDASAVRRPFRRAWHATPPRRHRNPWLVPPSSTARAMISGRVTRLPAAPSEPRDSSSVTSTMPRLSSASSGCKPP